MGFADLIKGMFSRKEEPAEEVAFAAAAGWLSEKHKARKGFLAGQVEGIRQKVAEEKASAISELGELKNAQLRNPDIPEKAKHFMEGNRETYIKFATQFIGSIAVPADAEAAGAFIDDFSRKIDEFSRQTIRAYKILSEFFEDEASRVALRIRNIDSCAREMKEAIGFSRIRELGEAMELLEAMQKRIAHRNSLQEELNRKAERVGQLKADKEKIEGGISAKEAGAEFRKYTDAKQRLDEASRQSSAKSAELSRMFNSLERPMKKYARIVYNDRDVLEMYIESPISALSQDFSFRIVALLKNLRKAIEDDTMELKDKQKWRALNDIDVLSKDFLSKFVSEYAQMKKKEAEIGKELKPITVMEEIRAAKERLTITSAMISKAEQDLQLLASEINKIDVSAMKKELGEKINSAIKANVVIS